MAEAIVTRMKLLIALLAGLVVLHVINVQLGGGLAQFGIIPRDWSSWYHIFTAPFIHSDFGHLTNNLVSLAVFSTLCLIRSVRFYLISSIFIIVIGGALVWLFGRPAAHVGASGWIFGLWSLSVAVAWFDRRFGNIALALLVVFLYGGMVFGVLPSDRTVSFEMHLGGAVAGVLCAFSYATIGRRARGRNGLSAM
jgi:membrane associated rhomboid family serine protease